MAAVKLLETRDLKLHFGGLRAVDGVNFALNEGEIHALIGPNGAGKTTFVSLLSGRLEPQEGHVIFDGEDITRLAAHQRVAKGIAYTFQITSIYRNLTVYENVELAAHTGLKRGGGQVSQKALSEAVEAALAQVGLAERRDEEAGALAYGHQRLLEVAMGLALRPRLLILDEPTQGLADGEIDAFCTLLKSLSSRISILIIEHNMAVVMRLADRISVLSAGRLLASGTPEAISNDRAVQEAYLGGGAHA